MEALGKTAAFCLTGLTPLKIFKPSPDSVSGSRAMSYRSLGACTGLAWEAIDLRLALVR